jgi:hypothetical protein
LRSVDLYGDTVFNQLQLPQLIDELRLLDTRQFDPAVKQHLVSLSASCIEHPAESIPIYASMATDIDRDTQR